MLKLQYFGHVMQRANSLMLGKTEGKRRGGRLRMRWLDSITDSMDMNLSKLLETVEGSGVLQSMGSQRYRHDSVTEQQQILYWTELICIALNRNSLCRTSDRKHVHHRQPSTSYFPSLQSYKMAQQKTIKCAVSSLEDQTARNPRQLSIPLKEHSVSLCPFQSLLQLFLALQCMAHISLLF